MLFEKQSLLGPRVAMWSESDEMGYWLNGAGRTCFVKTHPVIRLDYRSQPIQHRSLRSLAITGTYHYHLQQNNRHSNRTPSGRDRVPGRNHSFPPTEFHFSVFDIDPLGIPINHPAIVPILYQLYPDVFWNNRFSNRSHIPRLMVTLLKIHFLVAFSHFLSVLTTYLPQFPTSSLALLLTLAHYIGVCNAPIDNCLRPLKGGEKLEKPQNSTFRDFR